MTHLITIVSYARTGSNYLCKLIEESFPNVVSHYELFNKQKCHINEYYREILETHYNTPYLYKIADENPLEFLYTVMDKSEKPVLSHKIFPEHLDLNDAFNIVNKSDFLFINKRSFIDVYISKKRALKMLETHSNPWIEVDTTGFKIDFDKDEFLKEGQIYNKWFMDLTDYIIKINKPYIIINYDSFHTMDVESQQDFLKEKLMDYIPEEYLDFNTNIYTLNKQDTSLDYSTKINNYAEFIEFISSTNCSTLSSTT